MAIELSTTGQRIRFLREAKGWSQETLARHVCVSQPNVSQWESGKKSPSRQSLALLAHTFGVSQEFLLGELAA